MQTKIPKPRKLIALALVLYWLTIFIATHIPVPAWTRRMAMSDKTMHYIAFFILAVLLWLTVSFEKKVNWLKLRTWLIVILIVIYAVIDEILQRAMYRSADYRDIIADLAGAFAGLLVMTFVRGVTGLIILVNISVFILPYIVNSGLIKSFSILEAIVYFLGFEILTISWIAYLKTVTFLKLDWWEWIFSAGCFVSFVLTAVKFYSAWTDKPFSNVAFASGAVAILLTVITAFIIGRKLS